MEHKVDSTPDRKWSIIHKIGDILIDESTGIVWQLYRLEPSPKIRAWGTKKKKRVRRRTLFKHFTIDQTMMVLYGPNRTG